MPAPNLVLPTTFEQSRSVLDPSSATYTAQLSQFVQPVEDTEGQVVELLSRVLRGTGRAVLLLGTTGSGKSTFIQSLTWRKHLGLARLVPIDCSELPESTKLADLASRMQQVCEQARSSAGMTAVSIDYLESLGGIAPEEKRAFFQTLNGLLRKSPVLVVWPVTTGDDADSMLKEARAVSGTLFDGTYPVLRFSGPEPDSFPTIVRNTISVFNDGRLLQDFLLTDAELEDVRNKLLADTETLPSVRNYLERVYGLWSNKTGRLRDLTARLPKPNEVWCVFCYPTA